MIFKIVEIVGIDRQIYPKNHKNLQNPKYLTNLTIMIYDPESNILCWEIAGGEISHAREFGNFIIHLSASGKPILVEILDASKFIGQIDKLKNINDIKRIVPEAG